MSEQHELTEPALPEAPVTGNARVDRAVSSVADLADLRVAEQHDRLTAAHEALHQALDAEDEGPYEAGPDQQESPGVHGPS
ncbi:MAG: hypothetical protein ACTH2Q_09655 [Propionibacteriaceae bacterium]